MNITVTRFGSKPRASYIEEVARRSAEIATSLEHFAALVKSKLPFNQLTVMSDLIVMRSEYGDRIAEIKLKGAK